MKDKGLIIGSLALIVVIFAILYVAGGGPNSNNSTSTSTAPIGEASGPNLALAQCLKENGAVFYGAFWCPHCKKQKEDFGAAVPALPYIECSTPDGNNQTAICIAKNVTSYPTWVFPDGTRLTGAQDLSVLAEKGKCTQVFNGSKIETTNINSIGSTTPQ